MPNTLNEAWLMYRARLEKVARNYKQRHGKVPTLIIDGDLLGNFKPEMDKLLATMRQDAKYWATEKLVKVVFVTSKHATFQKLQGLPRLCALSSLTLLKSRSSSHASHRSERCTASDVDRLHDFAWNSRAERTACL